MSNNTINITLNKEKIITILSILSSLNNKIINIISCLEVKYIDQQLKFLISNEMIFCLEIYNDQIQSQEFSFIVDVYKFYNIINNCPGTTIDLTYQNSLINISSLNTSFTINTLTNINMEMPQINNYSTSFTIPSNKLFELIHNVEFCALKNNFQSPLNAIALQYQTKDNMLTSIGIDGHRLGINTLNIAIEQDINILIPLQVVQKIPVFLKNIMDQTIQIHITPTNIILESEYKKGIFALMNQDNVFPSYQHLIPNNNPNIITCNSMYLINILKRIISISTETIKSVRIDLDNTHATIYTKELSDNQNNMSKEEIQYDKNFQYNGTQLSIAINANYLIQILDKNKNLDVKLHIQNAQTAILISYNENIKYIVMPLKI